MRQSLGSTFLINWIIIFIIITFSFLISTLSYMKAYKINSRIANAIEKFEGYNHLANDEINTKLALWNYKKDSDALAECPTIRGKTAISGLNRTYNYCIYEFKIDDNYYNYGIRTYIYMDIPIIRETLKIPVYSETERIYHFNFEE